MNKNADIKKLGIILSIAVVFIFAFIVSADVPEQPTPFNSTYAKYGFYPESKTFIAYDGLRYQLRENGGIKVLDQGGRPQLTYGFGMTGNYNGEQLIRTEEDFDWSWTHTTEEVYFSQIEYNETNDENNISYVMTKHIFTGTNNNLNFNWTQIYEFTPKDPAKITHIVTNDFGDITNAKFWYIMRDPGVIKYNGQYYNTTEREINQQGNFNNILPRLEFPDGGFDYTDLLEDNFDLVDIRVGDGAIINHPNQRFIGLGFTKGAGNFNQGQTVTLDPSSTGFTDPTSHSAIYSQWSNPQFLLDLDNDRATEITVGDNQSVNFTFSVPSEANVTGWEFKSYGRGYEVIACVIKEYGGYRPWFTLNGSTSESTTLQISHGCSTALPITDTIVTKGSSTYTWGLTNVNGSQINEVHVRLPKEGDASLYVNNVKMNVYWSLPAPNITLVNPSPANNSIISSTYIVNVSSTDALSSCVLESNQNGTLYNYSMSLSGDIMSSNITLFGINTGVDDGRNFNYTVWCESGGDYSSINIFNVTSQSVLPNMITNSPENLANNYPNLNVTFNFTNDDDEGDIVDVFLATDFGNGYNIRNYINFDYGLENWSDYISARTIGEINALDNDTFRYFKMDGLAEFGESGGARTTIRDFSNNYSTYQDSGIGNSPDFSSTAGRCGNAPCLKFDGTNDNIVLESGSAGYITGVIADLNFSIGAWLYDTASAENVWFGKGISGTPFVKASQVTVQKYFNIYNETGDVICGSSYNALPSTNTLHHIVYTADGNNLYTYQDGNLVQTDDCSGAIVNETYFNTDGLGYEYYMGSWGASGTDNEWFGWMDEFFIVNRTLSAREVANIHRPIRTQYNWILRSYQSPNNYSDSSGVFYYWLNQIDINTTTTLEGLYTSIQDELPEDPSLLNISDGSRPCRYVSSRDINVIDGGKLILEGCNLEVNNTVGDGGNSIYVNNGSFIANYSNITKYSTWRYNFQINNGSEFNLKNSFISYAGSGSIDSQRGLYINTTNLTFINNTISKSITADLEFSSKNISIKDSKILGNAGAGSATDYNIYCKICDDIKIINSEISGSSGANIVILENQDLYLINSTHTTHNIGDGSFLYKQWYIDGTVQNSTSPLNDSEVTFYNRTGALIINVTTNESGNIPRQNVTEYIVNSTEDKIYQTNYSINATKSGYDDNTILFNFTTNSNFFINLTLSGADTCTYSSGTWNALCSDTCQITSNINLAGENFILSGDGTFEVDGGNITNWGNVTFGSGACNITVKNGGSMPLWWF